MIIPYKNHHINKNINLKVFIATVKIKVQFNLKKLQNKYMTYNNSTTINQIINKHDF